MTERKTYISILGVIACFCVVTMHVNNMQSAFSYDRHWASWVVIEGLCNFAVPVFFMISGANLIGYRERYHTTTFFRKRFRKAVVPFVVWSLFGMCYDICLHGVQGRSAAGLLLGIINVDYVSTYWFFIPLFMAYLTIPVLARIEEKQKTFSYMILVGTVIEFALPYLAMRNGVFYNEYLHVPMCSGWMIYLLIGYFMDRYEIKKASRILIYVLGSLGVLLIVFGTLHASYQAGYYYGGFKGFINIPILFYASAVFLLFKRLSGTKAECFLYKIAKPFVGATFGIYLIHRIFIEILIKFFPSNTTGLAFRLSGSLCVFLVSAVVVKIMQKIPLLRHIVP